jgi:hypothetical protein
MDEMTITRVVVSYNQGGTPQFFKMINGEIKLLDGMKDALLFEPKQAEAFIKVLIPHMPGKFLTIPVQ